MPPTDPQPPPAVPVPTGPPTAVANVNLGDAGNGFLGLTGWMRSIANFSAVVIVVALGCGVIVWTLQNDRADQREARTLFREAIKDMNDDQNRRTGEVKGAVDKNTDVMRELIAEFKAARHEGRSVPATTAPRPISPP